MNGKEVLSGHTFASRAEKEQKEEDNWFHCKEGPMIDIENEENKEVYKSQVILDFIWGYLFYSDAKMHYYHAMDSTVIQFKFIHQ